MLSKLSAIAMALSINASDASALEYKEAVVNNPISYSPTISKEKDFFLSPEQKKHLKDESLINLETLQSFNQNNRAIFQYNFERWIVEDGSNVHELVSRIIDMAVEFKLGFAKEAKYYKKHPSLARILEDTADEWSEILDFTKSYQKKAREANEISAFMDVFIPQNQEVLKALG